jgi:hypothetical protein
MAVAAEVDPLQLLGREPDERLLENERGELPTSVGEPEPLPLSPRRRRLVAFGATMTGVTLVGGLALIVVGLIEAATGGSAALIVVALVLGIILASTHWGWVHVAELTASSLEARRNAAVSERRLAWLARVEPYPRWEVFTTTEEDGSIAIVTVVHRPVTRGDHGFSFVREEASRERHAGDEPAAAVAERAELLRRQAAAETERAREQFEAARDAYERTLMAHDDEQQRRAALRAASEALSERINSNLRDPPLIE